MHFAIAKRIEIDMKTRDAIRELTALPLRQNVLRQWRHELGLSRAAVARILEVDPSTVFRQELKNPMAPLWYYALLGIRAEARDRGGRQLRTRRRKDADLHDALSGPVRMEAEGHRLTAEKMRADDRERTKVKAPPPETPAALRPRTEPRSRSGSGMWTPEAVKAAADRAEARSRSQKKK
jgi:hypothetical protein